MAKSAPRPSNPVIADLGECALLNRRIAAAIQAQAAPDPTLADLFREAVQLHETLLLPAEYPVSQRQLALFLLPLSYQLQAQVMGVVAGLPTPAGTAMRPLEPFMSLVNALQKLIDTAQKRYHITDEHLLACLPPNSNSK